MTRHIPALLAGLALGLATAFLMPCGPAPSGAVTTKATQAADHGGSLLRSSPSPSAPFWVAALSSPVPSSVTARGPEMAGSPRTATSSVGTVILGGVASYVDPKYGARYLALPQGRGYLVRITGPAGSVTRISTDMGPVASLHRVADLSFADFARLCGCRPASRGLLSVTVEFLVAGPVPTPPVTSTQP